MGVSATKNLFDPDNVDQVAMFLRTVPKGHALQGMVSVIDAVVLVTGVPYAEAYNSLHQFKGLFPRWEFLPTYRFEGYPDATRVGSIKAIVEIASTAYITFSSPRSETSTHSKEDNLQNEVKARIKNNLKRDSNGGVFEFPSLVQEDLSNSPDLCVEREGLLAAIHVMDACLSNDILKMLQWNRSCFQDEVVSVCVGACTERFKSRLAETCKGRGKFVV